MAMTGSLSSLQLALLAHRAAEQRQLLQAEPIAVVGVGCRFPGGEGQPDASDPDAFWDLLTRGVDAVGEVPASRWRLEAFYDAKPGTPGKMHCRHGGFLRHVDQFDPASFGLTPKEVAAMDPQHRLLLEVATEALESAGFAPARLKGSPVGVYLGLCTGDYAWRQLRGSRRGGDSSLDMYFTTGSSFAMAAGRIAYGLGLCGPAIAIDTACSSSLVAVDLAVRSLRDRTTSMALAGGVSLLLSEVNSICFAKSGMMASDGHCKTFDAAADGYVRGEGCGVVVLKRLADAVASGDPIWAVLRGTGVNQDGASAGLTVPNGEAQSALMRSILDQAQLHGDAIDVVEAHGTGTPLGDPIELKALAPIYGRPERANPLLLGSLKTNLGHLEGAAGIAGLIKAVLMVQRGRVPPHLHLQQPTPFVPWQEWSISIPTELKPWPQSQRPRRVAVSSFGFSGTNAHAIVEEAPAEAVLPWPRPSLPDWLLLSARTLPALRELVGRMAAWLDQQPAEAWAAICATSRAARTSGRWRVALRAPTPAEAATGLRRLDLDALAVEAPAAPRLAWVLDPELSLQQARQAMEGWHALAVVPTGLVHPLGGPSWLAHLVGEPPTVRLMAHDPADPTAADQALAEHGYSLRLPLRLPNLEQAVELWRAGVGLDWGGLAPPEPWPRQVLPTTPFDRMRCWFDEVSINREVLINTEADLDQGAGSPLPLVSVAGSEPSSPAPLDCARRWRVVDAGQSGPGSPARLEHVEEAELKAGPALDVAFWQQWLPRLQAQLQAPLPLHWVLHADPDSAGAQTQAIAAMLRTWMREAGPAAGGLIWAGGGGQHLQAIQAHCGLPSAGAEWRWRDGRVEAVDLVQSAGDGSASPLLLHAQATYLITGGSGALGMATARWLVGLGARALVLVSRRGAERPEQLAALERMGCRVDVVRADVADATAVRQLLAWIAAERAPLRGIVHAAGVLDDGLLSLQTPERCAAVAAAKLGGALVLDAASRDLAPELEFFVAYSSIAALLGSPGQVAYAAANGALDGLMASRRRAGLPGLSINWGPWAGEGMAAQSLQRLQPMPPEQALASLGRWLGSEAAQVVLADLEQSPSHPLAPRCRALLAELAALPAADPLAPERQVAVQRCLVDLLVELGGFAPADLAPQSRLDALGMDSLMTVELASAVHAGMGVNLGLGAFSREPTVASLAEHLLALLGHADPAAAAAIDLGLEAQLPEAIEQALAQAPQLERVGPPRSILLTGATGFLGAFLLADQLKRHPGLQVYCLVRADGAGAAKARVRANLEHYDLWQESFGARVVGLAGDLSEPHLGLNQVTWQGLAERLDGILHNGAQLGYVASYDQLKGANVNGTCEVLRLAATRRIPLQYISSTAVYEAARYRDVVIDETDDVDAWEGIHLGYSQAKWVSERLVLAAGAAGLPIAVYRPPLISGHSQTGAWHEGDFLHRMMRGCLAMGLTPELPMELDFVPVDYVAAAVGALAWRPEPLGFHVHLHHPEPMDWPQLLAHFSAHGAPWRVVPLEQWLAVLAEQPSNPLYPLQPFFAQRWGGDQLTYPELNAPGVRARPSCAHTQAVLQSLGVQCPNFAALIDVYSPIFLGAR